MPTAVISGASFGAARSGRYATRSIITFSVPLVTIATISDASSPTIRARVAVASVRPILPEPSRRDERADHEDLAVGEVDQLDDSVDERVAERDQRPDRAVREAGDEVVAEPGEVAVRRPGPGCPKATGMMRRTAIRPYWPMYFRTRSRVFVRTGRRAASRAGLQVPLGATSITERGRTDRPAPFAALLQRYGSARFGLHRLVEHQLAAVDRVDAVVASASCRRSRRCRRCRAPTYDPSSRTTHRSSSADRCSRPELLAGVEDQLHGLVPVDRVRIGVLLAVLGLEVVEELLALRRVLVRATASPTVTFTLLATSAGMPPSLGSTKPDSATPSGP